VKQSKCMLEPRSGKIALLYSDPVIRYSQYGFEQAIFRSRKNCDYKTPSKRDLLSRINQAEREDGREINSMHITEESPNGRMRLSWRRWKAICDASGSLEGST
jgi:hypothetical protein